MRLRGRRGAVGERAPCCVLLQTRFSYPARSKSRSKTASPPHRSTLELCYCRPTGREGLHRAPPHRAMQVGRRTGKRPGMPMGVTPPSAASAASPLPSNSRKKLSESQDAGASASVVRPLPRLSTAPCAATACSDSVACGDPPCVCNKSKVSGGDAEFMGLHGLQQHDPRQFPGFSCWGRRKGVVEVKGSRGVLFCNHSRAPIRRVSAPFQKSGLKSGPCAENEARISSVASRSAMCSDFRPNPYQQWFARTSEFRCKFNRAIQLRAPEAHGPLKGAAIRQGPERDRRGARKRRPSCLVPPASPLRSP